MIYIYISLYYLRELGLQTIRHLCLCVRCSLADPAVLLSGPPGFHVAQTLRFPWFIACPPNPFGFKAFSFSMCSPEHGFIDWIGPWRSRTEKSALL